MKSQTALPVFIHLWLDHLFALVFITFYALDLRGADWNGEKCIFFSSNICKNVFAAEWVLWLSAKRQIDKRHLVKTVKGLIVRGRIFNHVRSFYEWAVNNLDP